MTDTEEIRGVVEPLLEPLGLELYDVQLTGTGGSRTLRILVDGGDGVDLDLDTITEASRVVSPALDASATVAGSYVLEVSSPGLERPLRTPAHYRKAVGDTVSIKHRGPDGTRRTRGVLVDAGDDACTVDVDGTPTRIAYADVTGARTIFEWGSPARPGKGSKPGKASKPGKGPRRGSKERSRS